MLRLELDETKEKVPVVDQILHLSYFHLWGKNPRKSKNRWEHSEARIPFHFHPDPQAH